MPKRVVKVERKSGYDKTFRNTLTANVGTLVPIFFDEVIPDSIVNLKLNLAACLPPLVSDTYMNVRLKVEAFAIPHRLLMGNFEEFFADYPADYAAIDYADGSFTGVSKNACVPLIALMGRAMGEDEKEVFEESIYPLLGKGSLADYLDIDLSAAIETGVEEGESFLKNVLPFVAYHLVWQEWYRNPRVQKPAFVPSVDVDGYGKIVVTGDDNLPVMSLPFIKTYFDGKDGNIQPFVDVAVDDNENYHALNYLLYDEVNILSLRQRNFDLDYFTAAMVSPQQGDMAVVKFGQNGDPVDGFSVASLRAMNSIQQFRERNNLTSPRYQQQIYARYGTAPSDGVLQRPALIGAASYDVYSHGVTQTAASASGSEKNPFSSSLGARGGNAFAAGQDFIIKGFHAKEPMYIMVLASLVPDVTYSQGISRIFDRYIGKGSITDMANHILQNVGPQPIKTSELYIDDVESAPQTFAYADRYADWMIKKNMVHGEFRTGASLESFVLQRAFDDVPEYGSEFLEIPTDYLDNVLSVTAENMGFAYWMDMMLEYKLVQPLQKYCIPSLQDPAYEHGRSISLRNNGQLL